MPRGAGEIPDLAGLATTTGSPAAARAAIAARSKPPVASHTTNVGPSGRSRATSAVIPASSFASLQAAPLGRTATSNRSFATSTPTTTELVVIAPPQDQLVAIRPCTMRACDPGQLSGFSTSAGNGRRPG
jgi:hypothetical protein